MKISLTTLALLLSAAAVHALPADPSLPTRPPSNSDDMPERRHPDPEGLPDNIGPLILSIHASLGHLEDVRACKEEKRADCGNEEWFRTKLYYSRMIAWDRLLHTERVQKYADAYAKNLELKRDEAIKDFGDLLGQLASHPKRQKAAETHDELTQARNDSNAAAYQAYKLREVIAEIDETNAGSR